VIRLRLGPFGLDFDRRYGASERTGWSATWRGSYVHQFGTLPVALWKLGRYAVADLLGGRDG